MLLRVGKDRLRELEGMEGHARKTHLLFLRALDLLKKATGDTSEEVYSFSEKYRKQMISDAELQA